MAKMINRIGQKFNLLTIVNQYAKNHKVFAEVVCDCGVMKTIVMGNIINSHVVSCGCVRDKKLINCVLKHGLRFHPLYSSWCSMKQRCYNKENKRFKDWGGHGVKMCDEWVNDFMPFYKWAINNGWEKGLQIDKDIIPNKLGIPALLYSPEMCSIVTNQENSRHKRNQLRIGYNEEMLTLKEISERIGIKYSTLRSRYDRNQDIFPALKKIYN